MTHPISNERVEFLNRRAVVVNECIRLAQAEMYSMYGGAARDDLFNAVRQFTTERTAIAIELRALKELCVTP